MTDHGIRSSLARLVRLSPATYGYVGVASLLETVPGVAVPLLIGLFVDEVLVAANDAWTVPITVGLIAALIVVASLSSLQYRVLARLAVRLSATESTRFAWHVLRIPVPAVSEFGTGDLTARSSSIQRQSFMSGLLVPFALGNVIAIVVYTLFILALSSARCFFGAGASCRPAPTLRWWRCRP
ncbi:MAG: ABC transporter transmembrane domain-containing protein [Actinobacteria bacterium]|nr:ABC transporter transmembrane domain-containing protein [Actinomycetota bacterium]